MSTYRSHHCNQLRKTDVDQEVRLSGWIHNKRDLGGVLFIDLRDHYGLTQIVVPPDASFQNDLAHTAKESVIAITGTVKLRPEGTTNSNLPTGEVEVFVSKYELLGAAQPLPMNVFPEDVTPEDTRLKFRFLDLRRSKLHKNILFRSQIIASVRRRMTEMGFNEFQTPILTSSSPEGARDFLVPSRMHPGEFYALPQAPQQFKQLLMVSGFDRYFQIAPCFRDEDARADRSPGEFYQLDVEMSFVSQEDIFAAMETLLTGLFAEFSTWKTTAAPFPRISYHDAMLKYGSDKPDLRIPFEIHDATDLFAKSTFRAFAGKTVRILAVPNIADKPRSFFDNLEEQAKSLGAVGLAWITVQPDGTLKGPIAKFITDDIRAQILSRTGATTGTAIFFSADPVEFTAAHLLGDMRNYIAEKLELIEPGVFKFCWVVDFPMFEKDPETGNPMFSHNPFSMPQGGMDALINHDPYTIKAFQYDIVCNGIELSSGAIRNHVPEIMYKAFEIAGYGPEVVDKKFGGMINAFKYGAPPHGGIAPGIDRMVMLLANEKNIREVIAFPMTQNARDLLMGAPAPVTEKQLRETHITIRKPVKV